MEKVFIVTRYEEDKNHSNEGNMLRARQACRYALEDGLAPVCPRLFFGDLIEEDGRRSAAYAAATEALMAACDKVRRYGASVDGRMAGELALAEKLGKPIETFNSIGIPEKDWNSVKFKDDPGYQAACAEAGKIL